MLPANVQLEAWKLDLAFSGEVVSGFAIGVDRSFHHHQISILDHLLHPNGWCVMVEIPCIKRTSLQQKWRKKT
eukprot:1115156-Pelagomonas_calceolata.AAC.2